MPFRDLESPDVTFRRSVLVGIAVSFALLTVTGTVARHVASPMPARFLWLNGGVTALYLLTPLLARLRAPLAWTAVPVLCGLTLLVANAGFTAGGMNAPLMVLLPIVPLAGVCFGGRRLGASCLAVALALGGAIVAAERLGWTMPLLDATNLSAQRAVCLLVVVLAAFATGCVYEASRRRSEERLVEVSRLASLGTMAGGIAHEINNPLAIVSGYAARLALMAERGDPTAAECADVAQRLQGMTQRMARIIDGLRAYARDASAEPLAPESVRGCVEDALMLCQASFAKAGIELRLAPLPSELRIMARRTQVAQVILNVLGNARDAVEGAPVRWVAIDCEAKDGDVELRVSDSGKGVAPEARGKIFVPFFTTKEVGKGTGLGLSIALGIMTQHGGEIALDETAPHTTFVLRFPRWDEPQDLLQPESVPLSA